MPGVFGIRKACCQIDGEGLRVLVEWLSVLRRGAGHIPCSRTGNYAMLVPAGRVAAMWQEKADGAMLVIC